MDHRQASAPEKCQKLALHRADVSCVVCLHRRSGGYSCMRTVAELYLAAYVIYVSQALKVSSFPCTTRKNACCSLCVMGPGRPLPIVRLSTSRIGVSSAAVPVKNTSSAI